MNGQRSVFLNVLPEEIGHYCFVPGSVERAELIAERFDHPRKIMHCREFLTYTGELDGETVTVTSTGIGTPSASIAVEELFDCGARTMMRIGSCASVSPKVHKGTVCIPSAAVRMEGTSTHYLPAEFPAVPDFAMLKFLDQAAKKLGVPYDMGITITKESYYTEVSPEEKPVSEELCEKWEAYIRGGATSTSMEDSLLFILASSLGIRMASVMISGTDYKNYSDNQADYPFGWEKRAINVGVEAMKMIIRHDRTSRLKKEEQVQNEKCDN